MESNYKIRTYSKKVSALPGLVRATSTAFGKIPFVFISISNLNFDYLAFVKTI